MKKKQRQQSKVQQFLDGNEARDRIENHRSSKQSPSKNGGSNLPHERPPRHSLVSLSMDSNQNVRNSAIRETTSMLTAPSWWPLRDTENEGLDSPGIVTKL